MKLIRRSELCELIKTEVQCAKAAERRRSELADVKKELLEQAKLLEDYNRGHSYDSENIRKNTDALMRIYSYVLNL